MRAVETTNSQPFASNTSVISSHLAPASSSSSSENLVLTNSDESVASILHLLHSVTIPTIFSTINIHPNLTTSKHLEKAFVKNKNLYVAVEGNLSLAQQVHTLPNLANAQRGLRLHEMKELEGRTFTHLKSDNSHMKFIFNREILVIGSTGYDDSAILADGTEYKRWWGAHSNSLDFMLVIRDSKLIENFASHLLNYVPVEIEKLIRNSFADIGVNLQRTTLSSQEVMANFERVRNGSLETMFLWSSDVQKDILRNMILSAKTSIKLVQQDLQDSDIQADLIKAADNISVEILMAETPFRRMAQKPDETQNKSMDFLKKLATSKNARITLTTDAHVHAKALIIDDKYGYCGSAGFYSGVLNPECKNLNVGVITNKSEFIEGMLKGINEWSKKKATVLGSDLSSSPEK